MDILTNREWAILIWFVLLACFFAGKKTIREAFARLLEAFFSRHILIFLAMLLAYVTTCLWSLWRMGIWHVDQWKTTILWVLLSAIAAGTRAATVQSLGNLFLKWGKDTFKLLVLIKFVAIKYSLPLWGELLCVPIVSFIVVLTIYAERRAEYKPVLNVLNAILFVVGGFLLSRGIIMVVLNWQTFAQVSTIRDIYTPPLLSLTLIPFAYFIFLYSRYEQAVTRIRFSIPNKSLRDYALGIALVTFGPRTHLLHRWTRNIGTNSPSSKADVLNSMHEIIESHRREKLLPPVDEKQGWCPIRAGEYLKEHNLKTNDYHRLEDEWFASAGPKELGEGLVRDNISYFVEGNEDIATVLRLVLNVNSDNDSEFSETHFLIALQTLIKAGTGNLPMLLELQSARRELREIEFGNITLSWETTPFTTRGFRLAASISRKSGNVCVEPEIVGRSRGR